MNKDVFLIKDNPTNNKETMLDIDFNKWFKAMKSKMDFIQINQVRLWWTHRMDKTHRVQMSIHEKDKFGWKCTNVHSKATS